ncbi:lipid-A-disaccharide synthase [Chitinivibrio alkaliphilus]|uniref:Lipid-A-disaccharide synthase n=1 Tax=Chitinivibrio alkaliphilus ACht1 TaxID=1313304 RepID=U7D2Q8_9BACT|nr:lipid-A-disaccharide synthase [Chitinivibrio alkaliphilus]ERP30799.1 lipid-A-disaccharide synthase [Chitinivibrio alkaliphilus ACht1]
MPSVQKILFSVGDPSGDVNCACLIGALKERYPMMRLYGLGGPAMERRGFESLFPFHRFNAMGYVEVVKKLPFFLRMKGKMQKILRQDRPDLLVCVDYSGFNRPLMRMAAQLDIPVLWYIAPMIWAWKRKKHGLFLGAYATHIATIFPFEVDHWREFTPAVSFVGNPLYDTLRDRGVFSLRTVRSTPQTLLFVPGSRPGELKRMLPFFYECITAIRRLYPGVEIVISRAEYVEASQFTQFLQEGVEVSTEPLSQLYQRADYAFITSGTAALEAAFYGLPHTIVYKTASINMCIMKQLIRGIRHIGLINIMAGKEVVPELIQQECTPENCCTILAEFFAEPQQYELFKKRIHAVVQPFAEVDSREALPRLVENLLHLGDRHG